MSEGVILNLKKRKSFKNLEFWAESGVIHFEDKNNGEYFTLTRPVAMARAIALNETARYYPHASERNEQLELVNALLECIKEAKLQGDPSDDVVRAAKVKEIKKQRKSNILAHSHIFESGAPTERPGLILTPEQINDAPKSTDSQPPSKSE